MNPYGAPAYITERYDEPDVPQPTDAELDAQRQAALDWAAQWTTRHPELPWRMRGDY